jgi:bacillaene synthase trans-acting acyltransferase/trans-AT polyketide synthase/acyltransferase/oxidoreductase domain-containing protein
MYSGQGSQYFNMGRQLYDENRTFRYYMDYCDRIMRDLLGRSVLDVVHPAARSLEQFDRLVYTHPALLAIQYSLSQVFSERGFRPDYVLGYSLGEFVASVIANVLSIEQALSLVIAKAQTIEAGAREASMLAVLAHIDTVPELADYRNVWTACENYPGNFVVTGLPEEIARLKERLAWRDIAAQILPIRYGFHSPLMEDTMHRVLRLMDGYSALARKPETPLVSCVTTDVVLRPDAFHMWNVCRNPVLFEKTIRRLHARCPHALYIDMGPAGTLAGFVRMITGDQKSAMAAMTPFGRNVVSLDNCMLALGGADAPLYSISTH